MIQASNCICGAGGLLLLIAIQLAEPALAQRSVLVVFDPGNPTHDRLFVALRSSLLDGGLTPGPLDLRRHRVDDLAGPFDGDSPDLVITIGIEAAARLEQHAPAAPALGILLSRAAYQALHGERSSPSAAIFLDQPLERQFALARVLRPDARRARNPRGARR